MRSATYREIKADLLRRILGGEWLPGSLVPNEQQLAQEFKAARATVNRAMRELVDEGIIERRRKAGTRVRKAPVRTVRFAVPLTQREISERGSAYGHTLLMSEIVPAQDWLAERLNVTSGAEVMHVICLHSADGEPYQLEDRWINLAATPAAREADFTQNGPMEWLVQQVPFSDVEVSMSAALATKEQARLLKSALGDALFRVDRRTIWRDEVVAYVTLLHRPDYQMTGRY
ncbi:GntR family transcriptional regulator [Xinfangfangia sp. CPCC 101601]|uniref:GntR family transcriptional regulator n=1 Tax=Pseudogemmobacter lacusdianii TaxID=3069608 RepID=A0ABU0VW97_9RHOB|nr:GntR family transcriptional regulator [Xinfangfangia sp. CPCC 101601]MDQ2066019.1 GntR family transcriptional regulator [Xinfangfangia sp. CPCC 101601]